MKTEIINNASDLTAIAAAGAEAAASVAPSTVSSAFGTAANGISEGMGVASEWIKANPIAGTCAVAGAGLGLGYLAYRAFRKDK